MREVRKTQKSTKMMDHYLREAVRLEVCLGAAAQEDEECARSEQEEASSDEEVDPKRVLEDLLLFEHAEVADLDPEVGVNCTKVGQEYDGELEASLGGGSSLRRRKSGLECEGHCL